MASVPHVAGRAVRLELGSSQASIHDCTQLRHCTLSFFPPLFPPPFVQLCAAVTGAAPFLVAAYTNSSAGATDGAAIALIPVDLPVDVSADTPRGDRGGLVLLRADLPLIDLSFCSPRTAATRRGSERSTPTKGAGWRCGEDHASCSPLRSATSRQPTTFPTRPSAGCRRSSPSGPKRATSSLTIPTPPTHA